MVHDFLTCEKIVEPTAVITSSTMDIPWSMVVFDPIVHRFPIDMDPLVQEAGFIWQNSPIFTS